MMSQIHGSDAYLTADLERILMALLVAQSTQKKLGIIHSPDFFMGYAAAIKAVAVAVGVEINEMRVTL